MRIIPSGYGIERIVLGIQYVRADFGKICVLSGFAGDLLEGSEGVDNNRVQTEHPLI
jgi:hypothetical protein